MGLVNLLELTCWNYGTTQLVGIKAGLPALDAVEAPHAAARDHVPSAVGSTGGRGKGWVVQAPG